MMRERKMRRTRRRRRRNRRRRETEGVTWRVGVSGKYSHPLSKWLGVRSPALANGANSQASCLPPIWDFRTARD